MISSKSTQKHIPDKLPNQVPETSIATTTQDIFKDETKKSSKKFKSDTKHNSMTSVQNDHSTIEMAEDVTLVDSYTTKSINTGQ